MYSQSARQRTNAAAAGRKERQQAAATRERVKHNQKMGCSLKIIVHVVLGCDHKAKVCTGQFSPVDCQSPVSQKTRLA
jgi:hypothetical protein